VRQKSETLQSFLIQVACKTIHHTNRIEKLCIWFQVQC
jgi:hypothetical protein